jgi:hypothetical protein
MSPDRKGKGKATIKVREVEMNCYKSKSRSADSGFNVPGSSPWLCAQNI